MNTAADNLPLAVALTYDGSSAPRVVAKGAGELAEKIIATAQQMTAIMKAHFVYPGHQRLV